MSTTDSASQPQKDEPVSTQVDDTGDSQATEIGDDDVLVTASIAEARRAADGADIEIALDSNRSDINSGRSDDQSRLREPSRMNGSPGRV